MAENKKSFILYTDLIHVVRKLALKDRENKTNYAGELFLHILEYVNDTDPIPINFIVEMAFEPIKQTLKRDLMKYKIYIEKQRENGRRGGRPKKTKKPNPLPENPSQPKKADSDSDSVNDINKRKEIKEKVAFDECAPSNLDDFRDFLDYWFEHGTNDKKMRFEKEKSFSWSRRWKLWLKNKEKWKKEKSFAKKEKDRRSAYEIIQQVRNGTYGIDN